MGSRTNLRFLDAPGDVAVLMRDHDWTRSPLGPPEGWPQSLRSVVSLLLRSKFPMFVAWGPSLGFLYNDPYAEILGAKHPSAIGRPFQEIWSEIWDDISPLVHRAMAGEASYMENLPLTMRRKGYDELTWFTFSYSPVVDEQGDVAGMYCACTETTASVNAEKTRLAQMQRLRSLFEQAPGLFAVTRGRDHVYELANPAYFEFVGRHGILGLPVREALPELDQKFIDQLTDVFDTGVPYIGRRIPVGLRRGGEMEDRIVDFVFQPIVDDDGRVDGIFIQGSDITEQAVAEREQRLAQDALERSERALREADRRKDEFLAMLSHELRNPLAPISTASQLLMLQSDPARVRAAGEVIARQVRHMTELVDDLLDVSRVTRGLVHLELEPVNLKEVIGSAIEQVRPLIDARRHALRTRLPAAPLWVRGDRTRLTQIFTNLLNNAAKYTPEGGELDLIAHVASAQVTVRVCDSGQGIEPTLLPEIFELFTQAERSPDRTQGGLGIGLALVRSLVTLHGGTITAESEGRDRGAIFAVTLPTIEPPAATSRTATHLEDDQRPGLDVVVVDDNVDATAMLQILLEALGHRVRVFHRALDALDAIVAAPPDVAFLDIGLPDITGYELAREIRARLGQNTCVLAALSGYGQPQDYDASGAAGLDYHLVKPLDHVALLEVLARVGAAPRLPRA